MPDKRDMHKAKSHRNSRSARQQEQNQAARPGGTPGSTTTTQNSSEERTENLGAESHGAPDFSSRRNKSQR